MRHLKSFLVATALVAVVCTARARADYLTDDTRVPSPAYHSSGPVQFPAPGGTQVGSFFDIFFDDLDRVAPPEPGVAMDSFFDVFADFSIDGLPPISSPGMAHLRLNGLPPGIPVERLVEVEMLSLDLASMQPGLFIRESPSRPSMGQLRLTNLGGGHYQVDSFFDIFTEISLDGGQSWIPAASAQRMVGVPEPSSLALVAVVGVCWGGLALRRRSRRSR